MGGGKRSRLASYNLMPLLLSIKGLWFEAMQRHNLGNTVQHTLLKIHDDHARRPLITTCILMLLLLLSSVPTYAQSEANESASIMSNAAIAAPTLHSPASNTVSTALTDPPVGVPILRWAAIPGAKRYNVQISVSAGFATTVVDESTTATSYTHTRVLSDGTYFWRVRAEIDKEWGNFSEAWIFHKDWSAEGQVKPLLLAPADDPAGQQVITSFSPEHFTWEPVPGAAYYEFEISLSQTFNDTKPYRATTLKTHHTPVTQMMNNQYYWRVTPFDFRDNAGEQSEIRTFTFAWNQAPQLLLPEDELVTRFTPRFSWTAVMGASSYVLEVSSQENFSESDIEAKVTTKNTSYTLETSLGNNKDYFWRVRAVSPQKVDSPTSEVRRFRASWVEPPTLLSPPTRSINHIYPYFSWTPVAGAERYQIQIATGNGFSSLVVDKELINATSYTQPEWAEITFGGDYFWRVRAKDSHGNSTNWSNEQTFWFASAPPPNLIYPEPYYVPDAVGMPVHTDRTIANPIFVWDTTHQWLSDVNTASTAEIMIEIIVVV